jgi:hypothetical protein
MIILRPGEYAISPGFFQVNMQIHRVCQIER